AEALAVLLHDQHEGEVIEAQRYVRPPEAKPGVGVGGRSSRWFGIAHRADPPGSIASTDPDVGGDGDLAALDTQRSRPGPDLCEPAGVDDDAARLPHDVVGFLDRRERTRPRQVEPDAVLVAVAHEADGLEGFDDLDPVGAHGLLHPVGPQRIRSAHRDLTITDANGG